MILVILCCIVFLTNYTTFFFNFSLCINWYILSLYTHNWKNEIWIGFVSSAKYYWIFHIMHNLQIFVLINFLSIPYLQFTKDNVTNIILKNLPWNLLHFVRSSYAIKIEMTGTAMWIYYLIMSVSGNCPIFFLHVEMHW